MFDSGFLEMLLIGVIALLVIGPERLPGIAAKVGKMVGKARSFVASTRSDIEREFQAEEMRSLLKKQESEISELRDIMKSKTDDIRQDMDKVGEQISSSSKEFSDSVNESLQSASDKKS